MDRESLVERALQQGCPSEYSLYLYGSFVCQPAAARDIDLLMVTKAASEVTVHQFEYLDNNRGFIVNYYIVPRSVFDADACRLEYGGFYAHKFAFSFELLAQAGDAGSPADEFWRTEHSLYVAHGGVGTDTDQFIRHVHAAIFRFRPTVVRSLTKFLSGKHDYERLRRYLQTRGLCNGSICRKGEASRAHVRRNSEMFYKFWREYSRHKANGNEWSEIAINKMIKSLAEADISLVRQYFTSGESPTTG